MNSTLNLKKLLTGYVRVWNELGQSVEANNLVVYTGGDVIAQLLAGNSEYRISHMYFAYENTAGAPTAPAPTRSSTTTFYSGLIAPQDYLRAATLQPPTITAADANHNGNRATFTAIANSVAGENGTPYGAANNSKVWNVGLVAAPTGAVAGDVLYASFTLPTEIPAAGSGQISATWATEAD